MHMNCYFRQTVLVAYPHLQSRKPGKYFSEWMSEWVADKMHEQKHSQWTLSGLQNFLQRGPWF